MMSGRFAPLAKLGKSLPALSFLLVAGCSQAPVAPPVTPDPAKAIARTLSIIRSATPTQPRVLRVLFYGQSISARAWTDPALARLREAYPNVIFDARNMALGGFDAVRLERNAERDLAEFTPDLIVFHVYGDHRAYERIIQLFRSKTAADIIVQTDHVTTAVEPICAEGIQLRWSPPPGCTGHFRFKQAKWEDFMSRTWVPTMAAKYHLAMEPRRDRWDAYLKAHKLPIKALIADMPHPNERGWKLMAGLFTSWFETLVARSDGKVPLTPTVTTIAPPAPGTTQRYTFEGNRFELVAAGALNGKLRVTVDGKAPQDLDGCWLTSRVSRLPNVPDWPALSQVRVDPSYHKEDNWTATVTHLDPKQESFDFALTSRLAGPDGAGKASEPFTSPSGRIAIDPQDWILAYGVVKSGKGVPEGYQLHWSRYFMCGDQAAVAFPRGGIEQRHLIATGLPNGRHEVEMTVAADAPKIAEIRAYRPPLVN
jgi:hypothetical protein